MALHTFGRTLNWHVHLHVSVTQSGLTKEQQLKSLFFKNSTIYIPFWGKFILGSIPLP
ncbi:transposase (plasmid) [Legionella lytica]|uniref:Transposase n=2 Tax=Legionella lytica TaxID=96232 RepID=A0ABY4YC53_9GAMM|nr:transposase [Legionella lytica]USQ15609.1 transposase [Legionella lytica]